MKLPDSAAVARLAGRLLIVVAVLIVSICVAGCRSEGSKPTATNAAAGHRALTFDWTIDKSASPDVVTLHLGQSGSTQFTINVTKSPGAEKLFVDGQVCVSNDGTKPTEDTGSRLECTPHLLRCSVVYDGLAIMG